MNSKGRRGGPAHGGRPPALLRAARHTLAGCLRLYFKVEVPGSNRLPPEGPCILAPNHTSFLDGPLLALLLPRPVYFMTKVEMFRGPLAYLLAAAGQFPVRRRGRDRGALKMAEAILDAGAVLGLFPEGTRGEGKFERLEDGIGYLLLRRRVPVVPVLIQGTREIMPPGSWWPQRGLVRITVGAPFTLEEALGPAYGIRFPSQETGAVSRTPTRSDVRKATEAVGVVLRSFRASVLEEQLRAAGR